MTSTFELELRPRRGWQPVDFAELWVYRELFGTLVKRDVKIRYRQTVLGGLWAILQPLITMLIFTVLFNRLAGIASDGPPYALFSFAGLIAWTFFANAVSISSNSLIGNQQLISKVYFPRIFIPLASVGALVLDMLLSLGLMAFLMAKYRWLPGPALAALPIFMFAAFLAAGGVGLFFSALNVAFRDVKYLVPFLVQVGFFLTPVIYPLTYVPARYRPLLGLNLMAGIAEGFRWSLLGTKPHWDVVGVSLTGCVLVFTGSLFVFRRVERRFADIL